MSASHAVLVSQAVRWLRSAHGCGRVFAEFVSTNTSEIPDVIGWKFGRSILVEVKVSRPDFKRDAQKGRTEHRGMGSRRWYLVPAGLVSPDEVPDGWGLAESCTAPTGRRTVRRVVEPVVRTDYDRQSEIGMLLSGLRRHELGVPWDPKAGAFMPLSDPRHPGRTK